MYETQHLHDFGGLPAVDFQRAASKVSRPRADAVAWRVYVDPFGGDEERERPWEDEFNDFLDLVDVAEVRALVIGEWGQAYEDSSIPINLVTRAAERLTSLEAVFVGDLDAEQAPISWIEQSDITALLAAFPTLTELGVRGGTGLDFSSIRHERLRSLTIQTAGLRRQVTRNILNSELPALERLDLWLGVSDHGGDTDITDLAPLLSGQCFPRLRHLGLRNSGVQDEIATAIASAPIVAGLRSLDLSNGTLGDRGAAALLEGQSLTHLELLDLHHHFLTKTMEDRLLAVLNPHGVHVDLSKRGNPRGSGNDPSQRYVALSE
ncbi:STM4015 family protein [Streptomyces rubiginosohelvolus]|uniref:STM4015 family protein n=1 Tax=Streptomyces rubiginosohelvolus TaxID=67362 RepID=UPI0033ABD606